MGKVNDLPKKILNWLEKTGFPLEMLTAEAFRKAGFEVRQSDPYVDPKTEKDREIDVIANDPDWIGAINISFVAECKSSSRPWVVLTSTDAFSNNNRLHMFAIMSESALRALATKFPDLPNVKRHIDRPSRGGYGFRQALSENGDPAYAAASCVANACCSVVLAAERSRSKTITLVFPLIVVDAPLFECALKRNGDLRLTEVDSSDFLFSLALPGQTGCYIKVVTVKRLEEFARWAKQVANDLRKELKKDEDRIVASWKAPRTGIPSVSKEQPD